MPSLESFLRDLVREPPPSLPPGPEAVDVVIRTVSLRCPHSFCRRAWRVPVGGLRRGDAHACPGCRRTLHPHEVEVIE